MARFPEGELALGALCAAAQEVGLRGRPWRAVAVLAIRAVEVNTSMALVLCGTDVVNPYLVVSLSLGPFMAIALLRACGARRGIREGEGWTWALRRACSPENWFSPQRFSLLGLARYQRPAAAWYAASWVRVVGIVALVLWGRFYVGTGIYESIGVPPCWQEEQVPRTCDAEGRLPWLSCRANWAFHAACKRRAPWWFHCRRKLIMCDFHATIRRSPLSGTIYLSMVGGLVLSALVAFVLGVPLALASERLFGCPSPFRRLADTRAQDRVNQLAAELMLMHPAQRVAKGYVGPQIYAYVALFYADIATDAIMIYNFGRLSHPVLFVLSLVVFSASSLKQLAHGGPRVLCEALKSRAQGLYTNTYVQLMRSERAIEAIPMLGLQWFTSAYFWVDKYGACSWVASTLLSTASAVFGVFRDLDLAIGEAADEVARRGKGGMRDEAAEDGRDDGRSCGQDAAGESSAEDEEEDGTSSSH